MFSEVVASQTRSPAKGFRVKPIFHRWFRKVKSRIQRRLDKKNHTSGSRPAFTARNIDYDVCYRDRAIAHGGIGVMHLLAQKLGLPEAINERLHVLKIHMPYHESDHVLNPGAPGPTTRCATAPVSKTSNCAATTRPFSMPSALDASPIPRPPPTYIAASLAPTSTACTTPSIPMESGPPGLGQANSIGGERQIPHRPVGWRRRRRCEGTRGMAREVDGHGPQSQGALEESTCRADDQG